MFVSESPGFHGAHPCINGEAIGTTTDCLMLGSGGFQDGAGQWNVLREIPNLLFIVNGHSHNDSLGGMHSAQMVGTSGGMF